MIRKRRRSGVPLRDQVDVSISATVPPAAMWFRRVLPPTSHAGWMLTASPSTFLDRPPGENQGEGISRHGGAFFRGSVRRTHAPSDRRLAPKCTPRWTRLFACRRHSLWHAGGRRFSSRGAGLLRRMGLVQRLLRAEGAHGNLCRRADNRAEMLEQDRSPPPNSQPVRTGSTFAGIPLCVWVLPAPPRIVGLAIQPVSGAAGGGSLESKASRPAQQAGVAKWSDVECNYGSIFPRPQAPNTSMRR